VRAAVLLGLAVVGLAWPHAHARPSASHVPVPAWTSAAAGELGEASGVGVLPGGDVLVFHRASRRWEGGPVDARRLISRPTVARLDARTGSVRGAWGARRFAVPHGLAVAPDGTVWLTDVGLHQVFAVDAAGRTRLVMGERGVAGSDRAHFDMPTDVAVARDGSVYVSDGYGNGRVVKFSRRGEFLLAWGTRGSARGQFDTPHGIAVDARGRVYVADRGNARVQVFDGRGRLLDVWQGKGYGRPWAVRAGPDGLVYVVDGGDQRATPPDRARIVVCKADGTIVDEVGSYGSAPGEFVWPHAIAVGRDGTLYVGEVSTTRRVQKLVPSRARTTS
jgi:peptidylamidoglycolate lyase